MQQPSIIGYGPQPSPNWNYPGDRPRKSRFTCAPPTSWWFYIALVCMCLIGGVVAVAAAAGLVLGIVNIDGGAAAPAILENPAYYDNNNVVGSGVAPQVDTTVVSPLPSPSSTSINYGSQPPANSVAYQDLEARVAGLEERLRTLSLQQGPAGPRGSPGVCTTDQCGTASTSQGSTSTLRVSGDQANLMPPTIAQGPVSVRVSNGYVEIVEGGLSTKGPITTQSMFASPSDRRVKFNITPRNTSDSMGNILDLKPVEYDYHSWWLEHTQRIHSKEIGFIAQEVQEIFPFAVTHEGVTIPGVGTIEDFNMLNERAIIAELVGAVQYLYSKTQTCECA